MDLVPIVPTALLPIYRDLGDPFVRRHFVLIVGIFTRGIVSHISTSTVKRWLQADQIKPWQYRSWQQATDPRFLEKAIPILDLYERAQGLHRKGHIVVCTDEKTSIQARKAVGGTLAASPGHAMHVGDRYQRTGAVQLFAGLLVHSGETWRCFDVNASTNFRCSCGCSSPASGVDGSRTASHPRQRVHSRAEAVGAG